MLPPLTTLPPLEITGEMVAALQHLSLPAGVRVQLFHVSAVPPAWPRRVWEVLRDDGAVPDLFWWQHDLPEPERGQMAACLDLWRTALCLLVVRPPEILGLLWIQACATGDQAEVSGWFRRKTPVAQTRQVCRAVIQWAFATQSWQALWCRTISQAGRRLAEACGAQCQTHDLPPVLHRGRWCEIALYRVTRKE